MKSNPLLVLSSLSFIFPAILYYNLNKYYSTLLYIGVTTISSMYHHTKAPELLYLDIPFAHLSHLVTLCQIIPGRWASMPYYSLWLSYILYIYYYGSINKSMVWNPNLEIATWWHMTVHISTAATTCYTVYATHALTKTSNLSLFHPGL